MAPTVPTAPGRARAKTTGDRWLALFVTTRVAATGVAVALLITHTVTEHDPLLVVLAIGYGAASTLAALGLHRLHRLGAAAAAGLDVAAVLVLVLASQTWRSPFYLMALTSLVLPATTLSFRRALAFGAGFTGLYFAVAVETGIDWEGLRTTVALETFATHLMVPMLVVLALAYASGLVQRLEGERRRSERLAIEAERRRIAWELHDSAKQRVHAAHLILTSVAGHVSESVPSSTLDQAMRELRAATADMDASLAELRAPLDSRGLEHAVRTRAGELEAAAGPRIEVCGEIPDLPIFIAAHTFRVVSEAMTNAVRHADARTIKVELGSTNGRLTVVVCDDGRGMPADVRPESHGIRFMRARADTLGGRLEIGSGREGRGTEVRLEIPLDAEAMVP